MQNFGTAIFANSFLPKFPIDFCSNRMKINLLLLVEDPQFVLLIISCLCLCPHADCSHFKASLSQKSLMSLPMQVKLSRMKQLQYTMRKGHLYHPLVITGCL